MEGRYRDLSLIERVGAEIVERAASEPPRGIKWEETKRERESTRWEREREAKPAVSHANT